MPLLARKQYRQSAEITSNNQAAGLAHGAGTTTAQELKNRDVEVVLTGQVGPKAQSALDAAGMEIVTGASGKVREAVERHLGKA